MTDYKDLFDHKNTDNITIIEEDTIETEFSQKEAYINFGIGELSTYNLVNCISVGGIFDCSGKQGSFLTHESPTEYRKLFCKLKKIKNILEDSNCIINNVVLFRIDETGKDIYDNSLTVEDIIEIVRKWLIIEFKIEPEIKIYSCKYFMCGKAIVSPNNISTTLKFIKIIEKKEKIIIEGKFTPIVLENKYGDKVYKCPSCNFISGSGAVKYPEELKYWSHSFSCINKNKLTN